MQEILKDTPNDFEAPQRPAPIVASHPSPSDPPWNGWIAVGTWIFSLLFIAFVPLIFVFPYVASNRPDLLGSADLREFLITDPTAVVLSLAPVILAHILTLGLSWIVVTRMNRYSFKETLGWDWGGFKPWHAIAIIVALYGFVILAVTVFGDVETDFDKMLKSSRWAVLLVALFATFTAPLVEEVVYRGILYSAFQRRFGIAIAVILVTLLFTVIHIPQYSQESVPDYAAVCGLLAISLVLTLVRVRTNNLWPCIVLHTLFNGVQSLLLLLEPYLTNIVAPTEHPASMFFR